MEIVWCKLCLKPHTSMRGLILSMIPMQAWIYGRIGKKLDPHRWVPITPSKNNLFRKSNARTNKLRHENGCIKIV